MLNDLLTVSVAATVAMVFATIFGAVELLGTCCRRHVR